MSRTFQTNIFEELKKPDPSALAARPELVAKMIGGNNRTTCMGTGDLRKPVYRLGSMDNLALPSRIGNELHYRDGRVEVVV